MPSLIATETITRLKVTSEHAGQRISLRARNALISADSGSAEARLCA